MPYKLLKGLQHFRDTDMERYRDLYRELAEEGQHPRVLFVACSDSRIVPNLITEAEPGELFIIRTIGNIVAPADAPWPDATRAAVEFSIEALGIRSIVVCGHTRCGAMTALYEGVPEDTSELGPWVDLAREAELGPEDLADCADDDERVTRTAKRNVVLALDRLAALPRVAELRASRELLLHGWLYDIATSEVTVLDPSTGDFVEPETLLRNEREAG
jgi:carbonic anhydrase